MKIRSIPFGYKYENGSIGYDQTEMQALIRITDMYLDGMSLKDIADTFNRENIEYSQGVIGWNKSRIMRLLSDERYTGNGVYPAIISIETYELIQAQRGNNSLLADTDLHSDIYRLNVPIICPACGNAMKRKVTDSKRNKKCWCCPNCENRLRIDDIESNPAYVNSGLSVYSVSMTISERDFKKYRKHSEIIEALRSLDYIHYIEEMN